MKAIELLAWDNGFDFEKFFAGENKKVKFPSLTYSPKRAALNEDLGLFNEDNMIIQYEGREYYIGNKATRQAGDNADHKATDDKFKDDTELVKLLAGIELLFGEEIEHHIRVERLAAGINIGAYKAYVEEFINLFKDRGAIKYKANGKKRELTICEVDCHPQGIGAYYDELLDLKGNQKNNSIMNSRYGLIDLGGRTVDAFVVSDGIEVIRDSVTSLKQGTSQAYKFASASLDNIPFKLIQEGHLKGQGEVYYAGEYKSIEEPCELGFEELSTRIYDQVQIKWDDYMDRVEFIFLCGGGASNMRKYLSKLFDKEITVLTDPQFSNVRGYYKLSKV